MKFNAFAAVEATVGVDVFVGDGLGPGVFVGVGVAVGVVVAVLVQDCGVAPPTETKSLGALEPSLEE